MVASVSRRSLESRHGWPRGVFPCASLGARLYDSLLERGCGDVDDRWAPADELSSTESSDWNDGRPYVAAAAALWLWRSELSLLSNAVDEVYPSSAIASCRVGGWVDTKKADIVEGKEEPRFCIPALCP